ncbi:uncharacterized protein LOC110117323 isoform X2 [Athalia rosae]|uniref:uncharacterized protein LOC110117323 isoform X2 n=1 Tax=Athalia rosae TaxID=37344 RepID=UPI0020332366|nr:uncharacterized protein LOC110117323 isoform X2 [Athalia rosae]
MNEMRQTVGAERMSLSDATRILLVATRTIGMNPISWRRKVHLIIFFAAQTFIFYESVEAHYSVIEVENFWFRVTVHAFKDGARAVAGFLVIVTTFLNPTRYVLPLKDFTVIDETLENFGVRVNNESTFRWQLLQIIFFVATPFLLSVWNFYIYNEPTRNKYFSMMMTGHIFTITSLFSYGMVDCSFCTILSIIKERLRVINSIIHRAENLWPREDVRVAGISSFSKIADDIVFRGLKILREQYHELWVIAMRVNEAYGLHLLVAATSAFAITTVLLWEGYEETNSGYSDNWILGVKIKWAVFVTSRIFLLAQACESVVHEAKTTCVVLQDLMMNGNWQSTTKSEIRDFLMQHQLEVQDFTACNFFKINRTMVSGILSAVSSYLVILIQMGEGHNSYKADRNSSQVK